MITCPTFGDDMQQWQADNNECKQKGETTAWQKE